MEIRLGFLQLTSDPIGESGRCQCCEAFPTRQRHSNLTPSFTVARVVIPVFRLVVMLDIDLTTEEG
jgi:hypothetical protein